MALSHDDMLKRSVDSLQRLYAVVVGLAVTASIQRCLLNQDGQIDYSGLSDRLPIVLAFVATIVPFFHGMNQHLDRAYLGKDQDVNKEGYLVLDFFVFFFESCLLVAIALHVNTGGQEAFLVLVALLLFDALWGCVTHGIHYSKHSPSTLAWCIINVATSVLMLVVYYTQLFPDGIVKAVFLYLLAIGRTVADYWWSWRFYLPLKEV